MITPSSLLYRFRHRRQEAHDADDIDGGLMTASVWEYVFAAAMGTISGLVGIVLTHLLW